MMEPGIEMYGERRRAGARWPAFVLGIVASLCLAVPALADQPDAWITTKVKMQLLTDDTVDGLDVDVDTFNGRVTLHGKVVSEAVKSQAAKIARGVDGVDEVRNLLAVVPDAGRETTQVNDEQLAERVSTVLERDAALSDSDIEVESVNDGVVLLSGDARTLSDHRRALEDARSVEGVREVASEIESPDELSDDEMWNEGGGSSAMADAADQISDVWLTTKAKTQLMSKSGLSPLEISVDTDRGVVTLFGTVGTEEVKSRAERVVSNLDGVKGVENELQVVPEVAAGRIEAGDEEIRSAIEKKIAGRQALSDADIEVGVENRVARLKGRVASQSDRMTALSLARSADGVDSVIDDLKLKR